MSSEAQAKRLSFALPMAPRPRTEPSLRKWRRCASVGPKTIWANSCSTVVGTASQAAVAWDPNANGHVEALAVSGSTVSAGGQFTPIGGQFRPHLARFS